MIGEQRLPTRRSLGRVAALDGLRAIFVLLVASWHTFFVLAPGPRTPHPYSPVPSAFLGVDLFFVLSGFLITTLLLQEQTRAGGRIRYAAFYRRRALRLLPALFAVVIVYAAYSAITGVEAHRVHSSILPVLFYYSNWAQVWSHFHAVAKGLSHTWSLAVEEQFYLVWPAAVTLVLGVHRRLATTTLALLATIAAVEVYRLHLFYSSAPQAKLVIYTSTTTRCDGLLVGALIAQWWVRGRTPRRGVASAAWLSCAFLAYLVTRVPAGADFYYQGGFTLVAVAGGVIVLAAVDSEWSLRWLLERPVMTVIGTVSYGLYLWHVPVFQAVHHMGRLWPVWERLFVGFGVSAILTAASWRLLERPFLRLKTHLEAGAPATMRAESQAPST